LVRGDRLGLERRYDLLGLGNVTQLSDELSKLLLVVRIGEFLPIRGGHCHPCLGTLALIREFLLQGVDGLLGLGAGDADVIGEAARQCCRSEPEQYENRDPETDDQTAVTERTQAESIYEYCNVESTFPW